MQTGNGKRDFCETGFLQTGIPQTGNGKRETGKTGKRETGETGQKRETGLLQNGKGTFDNCKVPFPVFPVSNRDWNGTWFWRPDWKRENGKMGNGKTGNGRNVKRGKRETGNRGNGKTGNGRNGKLGERETGETGNGTFASWKRDFLPDANGKWNGWPDWKRETGETGNGGTGKREKREMGGTGNGKTGNGRNGKRGKRETGGPFSRFPFPVPRFPFQTGLERDSVLAARLETGNGKREKRETGETGKTGNGENGRNGKRDFWTGKRDFWKCKSPSPSSKSPTPVSPFPVLEVGLLTCWMGNGSLPPSPPGYTRIHTLIHSTCHVLRSTSYMLHSTVFGVNRM